MMKYEPCPHIGCRYHRDGENTHLGNCRYMEMTGQSRIKGLSIEQAMDKLHCPRFAGSDTGKKPVRAPVVVDHTNARIRELYYRGCYDREIAEKLGISKGRVIHYRKRNNLPVNKEPPRTRFDWDKAMELYRGGMSDVKIAAALGCSTYTVARWRERRKLPANFKPFGRPLGTPGPSNAGDDSRAEREGKDAE